GLPRHEFLGDIFDRAGDLTEVAGFPGCLLPGFDCFEVWDGRGIGRGVHSLSGVSSIITCSVFFCCGCAFDPGEGLAPYVPASSPQATRLACRSERVRFASAWVGGTGRKAVPKNRLSRGVADA